MYKCALCKVRACENEMNNAPSGCPGLGEISEANEGYLCDENYELSRVSSVVAAQSGKTRIEEIMEFSRQNGFKKIGLVFCTSMSAEAEIIDKIFSHNGFQTESVLCKVGSLSKELIGLEKTKMPMCNPIAQADVLNKIETDLNVIVGLCVGHDILFTKYSKAPVTVLAVKDRVLAHNPLGAVYLANTFYYGKLFPRL